MPPIYANYRKVVKPLITITFGNQGRNYLEKLRFVLEHGLQDLQEQHCRDIRCANCPNKTACSDVERAIRYLNTQLSRTHKP